eukprot:1167007-Pyramimonas_sp.AAC.1
MRARAGHERTSVYVPVGAAAPWGPHLRWPAPLRPGVPTSALGASLARCPPRAQEVLRRLVAAPSCAALSSVGGAYN